MCSLRKLSLGEAETEAQTMTLYHGSAFIIEKPIFGKGKKANDYGLGFYCTDNKGLAAEWSVDERRDGYVNTYTMDVSSLRVLRLDQENVLEWIAILLKNRVFDVRQDVQFLARESLLNNFLPDYSSYDVIVGYRADDSYFSYAQDFIGNGITIDQLAKVLKYGELRLQTVLKSRKAFEVLHYEFSEVTSHLEWYPRKSARDKAARGEYLTRDRREVLEGTRILDIMKLPEAYRKDGYV